MKHTVLRRLVPLLLISGFLVVGGVGAYAQSDVASDVFKTYTNEDPVVAKDKLEHQLFDSEKKFGIIFRPHIKVCVDSLPGEAHCSARVITDTNGTPRSTTLPSGMSPAQLLKAYSLSGAANGNPIVAIVDAYDDPNIFSDLSTYSATFGIPTLPKCSGAVASSPVACFQKVNQKGSTTQHPTTNSGWALEIALDVETVHAVCQNCSILLVEANSASYSDLMTAVDRAVMLGAKVVSNSYGSSEFAGESAFDSHFNHPGVAFTVSSGDSGYGAQYPAASPYVTAVGGTSLFLNADNSYNSEVAWSGAGSGCSAYEPKLLWQSDTSCAQRTIADMSADADPNTGAAVYDTVRYSGRSGWFQVGGTSLASPIVAATYALGAPLAPSVQANSLPYTQSASNFNDVVTGANGVCGGLYLCTALLGYDGPTGMGSPRGAGGL